MAASTTDVSGDSLVLTWTISDRRPESIFDYWVNPELLVRWWPEEAEIEPRTGGAYHLVWTQHDAAMRGTITEYEHGSRIGFTWCWDNEAPDLVPQSIVVELKPAAEGTELVLKQGPYGDGEREYQAKEQHAETWDYFVGQLQESLVEESEEEPAPE
jgi:uncharacterized protein YndB with AHSA1/START domain